MQGKTIKSKLKHLLFFNRMLLLCLIFIALCQSSFAQTPTIPDTPALEIDTLTLQIDTPTIRIDTSLLSKPTFNTMDFGNQNNARGSSGIDFNSVPLSSDSLDAVVEYESRDSMIYDIAAQKVYLYGDAQVKYTTSVLQADFIIFDWANNTATAEGITDSLGNVSGKPFFNDGTQEFTASRLSYNFKTSKGKIYDVKTSEGAGYLLAGSTKIIRTEDSLSNETTDLGYSGDVIYTTCNLDHPHFGVHAKKAKVVPNKLIVVGPSNIKIANIPTPLFLPFGFFPVTKGQRSGILFPNDFEQSEALGFGLRGVGYYFGISDYFDLSLTANIYTRGTWGINQRSTYTKRYAYRGSFGISFAETRRGQANTPEFTVTRDFNLNWNHAQATGSHPSRTFTAGIDFGTATFLTNTQNNADAVLTNTIRSDASVTKRFPGKPYSLSASFAHSLNTRTRITNITLPQFDFRMNQIFPFERKSKVGNKDAFYEKIGIRVTTVLQNTLSIPDTSLFTREAIEAIRFGVEHRIPVAASWRVFKNFNLSPSVNYIERWHLETLEREYDPTLIIENDTIFNADGTEIDRIDRDTTFGQVFDRDVFGFAAQRQVTASLNLTTKLFGNLNFGSKSKLQAIRHVMTPSIGFSISPDYTKDFWGYFDTVQVSQDPNDFEVYSIFDNGIYAPPPRTRSASLTYSIGNVLEAKVLNRKDSLNPIKKLRLLNSFNVRGNYNFALDSLNFSDITMNGNTRMFKFLNVNFGFNYSPYTIDDDGRKINTFQWEAERRPLRFSSGNVTLSTRLNPRDLQTLFNPRDEEGNSTRSNNQINLGDVFGSLNFTYTIRWAKTRIDGIDTTRITTNNISVSGTTINLTQKWRVRIGNIGYNFVQSSFTYPDFGFYRDLHCWEMGLDWQPSRRTFAFYLRVKPGTLDFLSVPYRRNQFDPFDF